jgi:hypothetical protein
MYGRVPTRTDDHPRSDEGGRATRIASTDLGAANARMAMRDELGSRNGAETTVGKR